MTAAESARLSRAAPLDILRVRATGQGKQILLTPDYGVSVESPAGVPGENVKDIIATIIPPLASGFLTVGKQDFFAYCSILRCTWKGMIPHLTSRGRCGSTSMRNRQLHHTRRRWGSPQALQLAEGIVVRVKRGYSPREHANWRRV